MPHKSLRGSASGCRVAQSVRNSRSCCGARRPIWAARGAELQCEDNRAEIGHDLFMNRALIWALAATLGLPVGALADVAQTAPPPPSPPPTEATPPAAGTAPADPNAVGQEATEPKPPPRRGINDKRRTVRSYPANLWYNTYGVVTKGNWVPLAVGAGLTGGALLLDDEVQDYFEHHQYTWFGNAGAVAGGTIAVAGLTLGAFSAGRIARGDRFRACTYDMSQAIIVNGIWTFAIKVAAQRERPNMENNKSFPSGHASMAFSWATVIDRHYGLKGGIPAYAVATFIATSRMAKHAHWLSDVVAGSALGFGIGRAVVRRNSRPPTPPGGPTPPQPEKPARLDLWPDFGPAADGLGLALTLRF